MGSRVFHDAIKKLNKKPKTRRHCLYYIIVNVIERNEKSLTRADGKKQASPRLSNCFAKAFD